MSTIDFVFTSSQQVGGLGHRSSIKLFGNASDSSIRYLICLYTINRRLYAFGGSFLVKNPLTKLKNVCLFFKQVTENDYLGCHAQRLRGMFRGGVRTIY